MIMNKALIQDIKNYIQNFNYEEYFYKKMNKMIQRSIYVYGLDICFNDFYYLYLICDKDYKDRCKDRFKLSNKEKLQIIKECVIKIYKNNKIDIDELIQLTVIKKVFNVNLLEVIPKLSFTSLERVKKTIDIYQLVNESAHISRLNKVKLLTY